MEWLGVRVGLLQICLTLLIERVVVGVLIPVNMRSARGNPTTR